MRVIHLDTVDSTNRHVRDLAAKGDRGPLWVRADRQSAGRGRLDRDWVSEPGNLFATALYPGLSSPVRATTFSFAAALAVADTVTKLVPETYVTLKWPNDVLLEGRKVSGLLLENLGEQIMCGIGINVAHHPDETRWPATHLNAHAEVALDEVFGALTEAFDQRWQQLDREGFDAIRDAWMERGYGLGRDIVVDTGGKTLLGRFVGLGDNGELMLATRAGTVPIVAGDVTYKD